MSVSRGCITHDGFRGVISKPASCTRVLASKKWSCFEYVGINFFSFTDVETRGHE